MENYKIIIKPIKPKVKETDPLKIEAMKEKRRLQREARKNKPVEPKEPKEPKIKHDYTNEINEINKKVKNLIGFSVDEINDKLKGIPQPQPIKNELKKVRSKSKSK
jgi:hypothetical protein